MPNLFPNLAADTIRSIGTNNTEQGGLRSWIENGSYVPSIDDNNRSITFSNVATSNLSPYLTFDYERFASASAESFLVSIDEWQRCKLISWPLLKLYYSAFFSAHAIMRSQGFGIVKIEQSQTKKINDFLSIINPSSKIALNGMYLHEFKTGRENDAVFILKPYKDGLGVHESFWKSFCHFINERAELAVEDGKVDSDEYLAGTIELMESLGSKSGNFSSWLSSMRNQINYQHKHDTWFPTKITKKTEQALNSLTIKSSDTVILSADVKNHPIEAFVKVCHYLALLNFEIADYVAKRSKTGRTFGPKWKRLKSSIIRID